MSSSPLQRLRQLLPFTAPAPEQRWATTVRELIDSLAGQPPLEVVTRLTSQTLPVIAAQPNLHMRFKLLEDVHQEAERVLPSIENVISQSVLPLPMAVSTHALHADNLLKHLAQAHVDIARNLAGKQQDKALTHLYHRTIHRAVGLVARRQSMAYRAYTQPSGTSWKMLHDLYRMTCSRPDKPLNGTTAPIENSYIGALLLAHADPGRFARNEFDALLRGIGTLAAYASISQTFPDPLPIQTPETRILVRLNEGSPGVPFMRVATGSPLDNCLQVDCAGILTVLDRQLSGETVEVALDLPIPVLKSLHTAFGKKGSRRFTRSTSRPRCDLIGGLAQVTAFLDGQTFSRRSLDAFSRLDAQDFSQSEWVQIDESPDGFRLRFVKGDKWQVGAGDIVALQPKESGKVHVCLVRRVASVQNRLELGVQLLAPQLSIVDAISENCHGKRAIFLHTLPAYGRQPGLIVPPGFFHTGEMVSLRGGGRSMTRLIGKCLEANDGLEFFALDPAP